MISDVTINLAVKDLPASTAFFVGLGFEQDKEFSTDDATNIVLSDSVRIMLLTEKFFGTFTSKKIADTSTTTEAIHALQVESREKVDELVENAIASGGQPAGEQQDHGFMYGRAFLDPDGHHWEVLWMDLSAAPAE